MKTLFRGNYNHACFELETRKEKYPVSDVRKQGGWYLFYDENNKLIARYHEETERLQVRE